MKQYTAKDIRNIALVGHAGSGKTSLAEAAFYLTGQADRLGRVADGTTVILTPKRFVGAHRFPPRCCRWNGKIPK